MARAAERLIQALRKPEAYPHPANRIDCIETHISWVLLTGDFAYKIKKPVRFPFLDFSTLELRKRYCDDELALNRRLAPELYLEVVPIGGSLDAPRVGATPAIEHAVKMQEFPRGHTLDHLLDGPAISRAAVHDLAGRLAAFHMGLPPTTGEPIEAAAHDNLVELAQTLEPSERARLAPIAGWMREQTRALAPRLRQRERAGAVRECHGDLHLGNLAWIDGRIVPFDCLEFDRSLRCIDTLDEIAFLVMDLMAYHRAGLAFELLNGYLETTGDYGGLDVLRLYLVHRALVRSKVRALASAQHERGDRRPEQTPYLDLAERLIEPRMPLLMITRGLSGSGKTTITSELVAPLPALRVRSDIERKRLHGFEPTARSESGVGAKLYTDAASDATYAALARAADAALAAECDVIVDAAFLSRARRNSFAALAAERGATFLILDFRASTALLRQRVSERAVRGRDASEAGLAVLEHQLDHDEPIEPGERATTITIDTSARVDVDRLVAEIGARRRESCGR